LDCSAYSLETFILDNVEPGSTIVTDSWTSYNFIEDAKCAHGKTNQANSKDNQNLYGVHLAVSLVKNAHPWNLSGAFRAKVSSKLSRRIRVSLQSQKIKEHRQNIYAPCPTGS
jgi:hypothetical protein